MLVQSVVCVCGVLVQLVVCGVLAQSGGQASSECSEVAMPDAPTRIQEASRARERRLEHREGRTGRGAQGEVAAWRQPAAAI